jgi:hypothetical protein
MLASGKEVRMTRVNPQDTDLLRQAVRAIQDAATLDDALRILVAHLQTRLELFHLSIGRLVEDGTRFRILASWSLAETTFVPGTEVATTINPAVEWFLATMLSDEVAIGETDPNGEALTDYLLREEGVVCMAGVPVHRGDGELLFLALGSSALKPLTEVGDHFFHGLAAGIRGRLCALAGIPL